MMTLKRIRKMDLEKKAKFNKEKKDWKMVSRFMKSSSLYSFPSKNLQLVKEAFERLKKEYNL